MSLKHCIIFPLIYDIKITPRKIFIYNFLSNPPLKKRIRPCPMPKPMWRDPNPAGPISTIYIPTVPCKATKPDLKKFTNQQIYPSPLP